MKAFRALVGLYLRDLARRKLLWIVVLVAVGGIALNYWSAREMDRIMGAGASWAMATRRAASHLEELASTVREWMPLVVVMLASLVAPESRRNGTTTFALSSGVRRDTLAAAQFAALALLIAALTLLLHISFVVAYLRTDGASKWDLAFAWPLFFVPMAGVAAAVLAFSLTSSTMETLLVFLGVPFFARILPHLMGGLPGGAPAWIVRTLENVALLFPDASEVVTWPHARFAASTDTVSDPSALRASVAHLVLAICFWVALGVYRHRRHNFGSRMALK